MKGLLAASFAAVALLALGAGEPDGPLEALRRELGEGIPASREGAFLVGGDVPEADRKEAVDLLARLERAMRGQFGMAPLSGPYRLYLWKDGKSYKSYCKNKLGSFPTTPYGFMQGDRLVMNYGTGSGTLVHEAVHAYLRENLPGCPAWFNEGLASLYERCSVDDGEIRGYPNWRLPRLQEAIRRKETLPLARLAALSEADFYGAGSDLHYAQSRYLLYHLQEEGRLVALFTGLRQRGKDDPSGAAALAKVAGDLEPLAESAWVRAMALREP